MSNKSQTVKKAKVFYADLWGLRKEKYKFLEKKDIANTDWQKLDPKEPQNFFVSKDFSEEEKYQRYFSLGEIFIKFNAGIATGKDDILTAFSKENLQRKLDISNKQIFELDMNQNKVERKLIEKWYEEIKKSDIGGQIRNYDYRPFDNRYIFYNPRVLQRARDVIMKNMLQENLSLLCMRQYMYSAPYSHAFVSKELSDRRIFISNRGAAHVFPLYIYDGKENQYDLFLPADSSGKMVNFKQPFLDFIDKNLISQDPLKRKIFYEEILYYIYAVLYSNTYREKYQEFLKIDFPRIPITSDYELFKKFAELGEELVNLHLLKAKELDKPVIKFQGKDGNLVEKREYENKRVYINASQYFEGIGENIWNYYIGGYQVLDKWLKDRKGKILSSDDIKHYCKVITALSETIKLQSQIDSLYPNIERSLTKQ